MANTSGDHIGRYERDEVKPSVEVVIKIADALGCFTGFPDLWNGRTKGQCELSDPELINQFKAIEGMDEDDRNVVKKLIDAFITKKQIQKLAH